MLPRVGDPWEDSASAIHFTAVKKDVLVYLRLAPEALVKKLVANAVEKI
jgi:hypothetical protein